MRELSLHILDIVQNSIAAGASRVVVSADANRVVDLLQLSVVDNGVGMTDDKIKQAMSPFWTTRTTRRVGLGLPMFAAAAEACEGCLNITSGVGEGTRVDATFQLSHIDRAPFGDIGATMIDLIVANPEVSFRYEQSVDGHSFHLDTEDIRRELGDVPIDALPVRRWMKGYLAEGLAQAGEIS